MKPFIIAALLFASPAFAGFTVPALPNPVNDYAGVLSDSGKEAVAQQIVKLKQETKAQVGVLIVNTLDGDSVEDASMRVARAWKLGSKEKDDGTLLLVSIQDHKMRIEVGYGLESVLTDATSKRILGSMKPYLRAKQYDDAIKTAIDGIFTTVKAGQDAIASPKASAESGDNTVLYTLIALAVLAVIGFFVYSAYQENKRREAAEAEFERQRQADDARRLRNEELRLARTAALAPSSRSSRALPVAAGVAAGVLAAEAAEKARKRRKAKEEEEEESSSRRRSSYSSYDSGSSSSSSSYDSGSSSSSSDWGGGGDFGGGGSSDSW